MDTFIKNIILYDPWQNVSGFTELKVLGGRTHVKLRHNLPEHDLILSIVGEDNNSHVFNVTGANGTYEIREKFDLAREVTVCLCIRQGNKVTTLASGIINPTNLTPQTDLNPLTAIMDETQFTKIDRPPGKIAPTKIVEVDELLRKVCTIDDAGRGQCETCPYRDYFFEFTLTNVNRNANSASAALFGMNKC